MAVAIGSPTVKRKTIGSGFDFVFPLTFSGNYVNNGEAADFGPLGPLLKQPILVTFMEATGWDFKYDLTNKKILVFGYSPTDATAGVIARQQHAAAAYAAAITGGTILAVVTY